MPIRLTRWRRADLTALRHLALRYPRGSRERGKTETAAPSPDAGRKKGTPAHKGRGESSNRREWSSTHGQGECSSLGMARRDHLIVRLPRDFGAPVIPRPAMSPNPVP